MSSSARRIRLPVVTLRRTLLRNDHLEQVQRCSDEGALGARPSSQGEIGPGQAVDPDPETSDEDELPATGASVPYGLAAIGAVLVAAGILMRKLQVKSS